MKRIIKSNALLLLLCFLGTHILRAQVQHWQFDPYAWEFDMTAYVQLTVNGQTVSNYADYEVAAFCGDECRGVAKVLTMEDETPLLYLRIRSNATSNETISFRIYQASIGEEVQMEEPLEFKSQTVVGTPSAPMVLKLVDVLLGDVNGDGKVNLSDAAAIVKHYVGQTPETFNKSTADVDGNGVINLSDARMVVGIFVGKQ